jgi:hypothetical protein
VLHFADGRRGDDDGLVNGIIEDPGAIAIRIFASAPLAFVTRLYEYVLQREPDPSGLASWIHALRVDTSRRRVARAFVDSTEHSVLLVDQAYWTYLHRAPSASEVAAGLRMVPQGSGWVRLADQLLRSPEYARAHPTRAAFLAGVIADVFGRTATPSDPMYRRLMRASLHDSRALVARAALTSRARSSQILAQSYESFLERAPSLAERESGLPRLRAGALTPDALAVDLLASTQFFDRIKADELLSPSGTGK